MLNDTSFASDGLEEKIQKARSLVRHCRSHFLFKVLVADKIASKFADAGSKGRSTMDGHVEPSIAEGSWRYR